MKSFLILIVCCILAIVAGGCAQLVGGYKTTVRVWNSSDLQLSDLQLVFESGFDHRFGYISSQVSKVYGAPIPASLFVEIPLCAVRTSKIYSG
jgi:hypothetical protein